MENENNQPVVNQADNKPFSFKKEISTPMAILAAGVIIAIAVIYSNTGGIGKPDNAAETPKAPQAQVSAPQFKQCLDSGRNSQKVEEDSQDAVASGGRGTPYNVIVGKDGKFFAFSGALPYAQVKEMTDNALAGKAQTRKSDVEVSLIKMKPVSDGDHILGDKNASVKIVEFSDTECPFCKRFHTTMQQVVKDNNGQVAWVYRHFPLDQLHSKARKEAEATECAAEMGGSEKFWAYLNRIMEVTPSNNGLDPAELPAIAAYVGLK